MKPAHAIVLVVAAATACAHPAASAPVELGVVAWGRDVDAALARASEARRPVFALFQEVPGCATCVSFGESVLSHPLMVEAIESEFVPVAVLNNPRPGPAGRGDRAALARFDEPTWNNPVVRLLDGEGRDLLPRRPGVYTRSAIATRMVAALDVAGREAPAYLRLLAEEGRRRGAGRATFAMGCFWEGEACLGDVPGVLATRPGWADGREVVEVEFDPARLDREALAAEVRRRGCARELLAPATRPSPAKASDEKFHLRRSSLASLALTPLQRVRVNAALAAGRDPRVWLSPRQQARLAAVEEAGS